MRDPLREKRALELFQQTLEQPDHTWDTWLVAACGNDTLLLERVRELLAADHSGAGIRTGAALDTAAVAVPPERIGPYRITGLLGEGGMGAVYKAERADGAFSRQVAIKFMRGGLLGTEAAQRFANERQILAGMHHPNIAQLLDGGTQQGRPYLVIEFVEGARLGYDAGRPLPETLAVFLKILDAVQFAHNNFVLHRDIKPANVMVTSEGEPKLLDFGVAKLSQDLAHLDVLDVTGAGIMPLTPNYAAPERFIGEPATVRSDVYSLGVMLYQLLHGRLPCDVSGLTAPEAYRALTRPAAERAASRHEDLDLIVDTALRAEPERRFATVAQLADDLERFLDGRPLSARGDDRLYVLKRFVQRNRALVAGASAGLIMLVAALAVTTWAYLRAEAALAESGARFDQVRTLANTLMFDIYDDVEAVSGTTRAREAIATTAQNYLDDLSRTRGAPLEVRIDAARGYTRLAKLNESFAGATLGESNAAEEALNRAGAIFAETLVSAPEHLPLLRAAGGYYYDRAGRWLYKFQDTKAALAALEQGRDVLQRAARLSPQDVELFSKRMSLEIRVADVFKWDGDYQRALAEIESTRALVEARRAAQPAEPRLHELSGLALAFAGEIRVFADDVDGGIAAYDEAIRWYRRFGGDSPNHQTERRIAVTAWLKARALGEAANYEAALAAYQEALPIIESHVARDPSDMDAARTLAIMRGSVADVLSKLERSGEALTLMLAANDWFEAQATADPDSPRAHRSMVVGHQVLADAYAAAARMPEACRWWRQTRDEWQAFDAHWGLSGLDLEEVAKLDGLIGRCTD